MADGTIHIDSQIDSSGLKPQLSSMKKSLGASFASMRDIMMGPVGAAKMVIGAVQQVGEALDGMIMSAAESEKANALLASTLTATGANAWTSTGKLNKFSESMSQMTLYEDDAITGMQGILLGFKNIKGDNFDKASEQILNMSTVMGMDLTSAAQAVGKALDNPAQGMDSLSRQGFKFTQQEKDMMKAMQEAGNLMGAQKIILDELSSTYGGAAAAAADTATGSYQNLKKAIGELGEELGKQIAASADWKKLGNAINNITGAMAGDRKITETITALNKMSDLQGTLDFKHMTSGKQNEALAAFGVTVDDVDASIARLNAQKKEWNTAGGIALAAATGKNIPEMKKAIDAQIKSLENNRKTVVFVEQEAQKRNKLNADEKAAADEKEKRDAENEKKRLEALKKEAEEAEKLDKERIGWVEQIAQDRDDAMMASLNAQQAIEADALDQYVKDQEDAEARLAEVNKQLAEEAAAAWGNSMNYGASILDTLSSGIKQIAGESGSVLSGSMSALSSVFTAAASNFTDIAADINAVTAIVSLAGSQMPELFSGLIEQISAIAGSVTTALAPIFSVIISSVAMLLPLLQPFIDVIGSIAQLAAPFVPLLAAAIQLYRIFSGLEFLLPLVTIAVELIAEAITFLYNKGVVIAYNWIIIGFNKIFNAFADFINGLLKMVDDIPGIKMSYRVAKKDERAGTLAEISTGGATGATGTFATDLAESNAALKKNKELFTLATKAADAYAAVLSGLTDTIASFYDGLKNIGSDISGMIIDSINSGFDNDDFLYALEQYITQSVIQAAVFTESFTAQVSQIGTALAQAIARGDSSAIEALKNQLSALASAAAITAQAATDAVAGAFGSYAVGSLGLPSDGPIYAHAGEGVIPAGLMSEAFSKGLTIAPTSSLLSGLGNITINLEALLEVDGLQMARASFRYQDEVAGAAYGG